MPAEFSTITVIGPDGAASHTGELTAAGRTISTAIRPGRALRDRLPRGLALVGGGAVAALRLGRS